MAFFLGKKKRHGCASPLACVPVGSMMCGELCTCGVGGGHHVCQAFVAATAFSQIQLSTAGGVGGRVREVWCCAVCLHRCQLAWCQLGCPGRSCTKRGARTLVTRGSPGPAARTVPGGERVPVRGMPFPLRVLPSSVSGSMYPLIHLSPPKSSKINNSGSLYPHLSRVQAAVPWMVGPIHAVICGVNQIKSLQGCSRRGRKGLRV